MVQSWCLWHHGGLTLGCWRSQLYHCFSSKKRSLRTVCFRGLCWDLCSPKKNQKYRDKRLNKWLEQSIQNLSRDLKQATHAWLCNFHSEQSFKEECCKMSFHMCMWQQSINTDHKEMKLNIKFQQFPHCGINKGTFLSYENRIFIWMLYNITV